ncbi:TnsA endonuclease N-terminal domain-containing protein [Paenibacillus sp. FSL L8-0709]|jgi:hypothetical protein|uniref:TnsA endonuclease N-terminal domain-containing protein n=1 Tax=Paenibacillus sp. FSL L8-0709 TaxID=2975312 RepID=UPI0030F95796
MSRRASRLVKLQENYIKKGRGQGTGSEYQPFIQAHDNKVASEGWITRHKGWKTKRIHHTLSEHERKYLYYCEWLDGVIDIREQFPLLPLERTIEISNQLGIQHAHIDGSPVIMTTDFMLTIQTSNGLTPVVRTIKPLHKLDTRTLELFEIERRFFEELGIDWCIITENRIPTTLVTNIEWMSEARYLETRPGMDEELLLLASEVLIQVLLKDACQTTVGKLCLMTDRDIGLQPGTCMFVLQHMLANKRWKCEMNNQIIREMEPLEVLPMEKSFENINLA